MSEANSSPSTANIIFECKQHSAIIIKKLQNDENELYDTVLKAGSGQNCINIKAHKIVLFALSEYFLQLFRDSPKVSKINLWEIEIKEVESSTLKLIIDFMYSGSIELSIETVDGILRAAIILKINTLVDGCCEFIEKNINSSNSLSLFRLAKELSLSRLKIKSLECTYTHFEEISKGNELLMLSENELMDLLFDNSPHGVFEENVILSVVKWINYDKSKRKDLILQLLSNVRYQDLTPGFIVENISTVCESIEVYDLIFSWLRWHFAPLKTQRNMCDKLAIIQTSDTSQIRIQTYNMEVNSWSIAKQIHLWKDKMCFSTIVIDDKLFVVGGKDTNDCRTNSVECLNLNNFEWTSLPPMKNSRCFCHLADLKGYLCAYDGFDNEHFENSVEIYNFSTHQWFEVKPEKPTKMAQIAAHDGILYILDFYNGYLQCYDASSNRWAHTKIDKISLGEFGFVAVERYLYAIGGKLETNVKRYNLSNNSWSFAAPLSYAYTYIKSTVFENKILICAVGSNGLTVVEEYNPERDTWTTLSPISTGGSFKTSLIFTLSGKIQFN